MRIAVLVVAGLAMGAGPAVAQDPAERQAILGLSACGNSFMDHFINKKADAATLDVALSAYCMKSERALRTVDSKAWPPETAEDLSNDAIQKFHRLVVGRIVAYQLQAFQ